MFKIPPVPGQPKPNTAFPLVRTRLLCALRDEGHLWTIPQSDFMNVFPQFMCEKDFIVFEPEKYLKVGVQKLHCHA